MLMKPSPDTLANDGTATEENITPLLTELVAALDTTTASLNALGTTIDTTTGGTEDDVAREVSAVYTEIFTSMDNLRVQAPSLATLIPSLGLDLALQQVLLGLQILLAGVLRLVANL